MKSSQLKVRNLHVRQYAQGLHQKGALKLVYYTKLGLQRSMVRVYEMIVIMIKVWVTCLDHSLDYPLVKVVVVVMVPCD